MPWVKIFTKPPYKELTEVPDALRAKLWRAYGLTESEMISFFRPDKINMASFGNYLPRVHMHVMACLKALLVSGARGERGAGGECRVG
ncbi:diadenosine tetraphosphate (Ap4A) hydrolase and other HIT family hydrolases [Hydrogenimonas sp.]|nr:diadenosine tetraphosphate (Ap4A) hydrolase and other HIT family hydrolases [Hydrogenimonas sp.]